MHLNASFNFGPHETLNESCYYLFDISNLLLEDGL